MNQLLVQLTCKNFQTCHSQSKLKIKETQKRDRFLTPVFIHAVVFSVAAAAMVVYLSWRSDTKVIQ